MDDADGELNLPKALDLLEDGMGHCDNSCWGRRSAYKMVLDLVAGRAVEVG